MSSNIPSEAPPSYQQATGSSHAASSSSTNTGPSASAHLEVPGVSKNGISAARRRSMEDEGRPLPEGWVRTFDPETLHQFFVDTTKSPPRSIWTHPYDDNEYLSTLTSEERERIEEESLRHGQPSKADIMAEHTDEEDHHSSASAGAHGPPLPPRAEGKGKAPLGRRLKDKLTGTTHEQREIERKRRAEEEERYYQQHMQFRAALVKAAQTGQPQYLGKDKNNKDVYVDPPAQHAGYGYGGGYGYNPYTSGMYARPQYMRPVGPYQRPYGRGYGGGYGLPLAVGGGLLGGLLLTDMMF